MLVKSEAMASSCANPAFTRQEMRCKKARLSRSHGQSVFLVHPLMLPGSLLKPFARTHAPLPPALPPFHAHHVSFPERIEAEDGRKRGHPMFSREAMVTWAVEVRSHIVVQAAIDKRGNFT